MNPYAANKVLYHLPFFESLQKGEHLAPIHVQLSICDKCNHNCSYCSYRHEGYTSNELFDNKNIIPYEKVIQLLQEFQFYGIKALKITGGGEPLMHPNVHEIFAYLRDESKLRFALVTSGDFLNAHIANCLVEKGTWLRVSLDAAYPSTYRVVRNTNSFDTVLMNVDELIKHRDQKGSNLTVGLSFIVTKDNWTEIQDFVNLAANLGVDNVRIGPTFSTSGDDYYKIIGEEVDEILRDLIVPSNLKIANQFWRRKILDAKPDYSKCWFQQFTVYIGADQNIYRCCVYAYSKRGLLGRLKGKSFREVWYSEELKEKLQDFNARQCNHCSFDDKNRTLLDAVNGGSDHNYFV